MRIRTQGALLDVCRNLNQQATADIPRLTADLNDGVLAALPPLGGWSVAQVLEHLCVADDAYLADWPKWLESATRGADSGTPWRPTLMGRMLVASLRNERIRQKAPSRIRPGPIARPDVIREHLKRLHAYADLLDAADVIDLSRTRIASPVNSLVRMNLGDAYLVLPVHTARHLNQIRRVRSQLGLPMDG